jgi:hypothetical protein
LHNVQLGAFENKWSPGCYFTGLKTTKSINGKPVAVGGFKKLAKIDDFGYNLGARRGKVLRTFCNRPLPQNYFRINSSMNEDGMAEATTPITPKELDAMKANIPSFYFNGFANSIGTGDVSLVLTLDAKPVLTLNASYTVAKTLAIKLAQIIQILENTTGQSIMTVDQITGSLAKSVESTKKGEDATQ